MLERYIDKQINEVWEEQYRFQIMLKLELEVMKAQVADGELSKKHYNKLVSKSKNLTINIQRIKDIEKDVKHDIIAFLTFLEEQLGIEARFLHRGMTSSDLIDTIFAYQMKQAGTLILSRLENFIQELKNKAIEHKSTPILGRSHGMAAEPTSFGLKILSFYAEFSRLKINFSKAVDQIGYGKISGAVGTYSNISPKVEEKVLTTLNLKVEEVSSQVVPRDRHACFFANLALIASSIERFATEIRHLSRSEVLEVEELFSNKQKGSSAMPHKKNPILSENITGLARLIRSYAFPAMENVALWHERDISHSSVERVIAPDATILTGFILNRATNIIKNLVVHSKKMKLNLKANNGVYNSQAILLKLTDKGLTRDEAYRIVQKLTKLAANNNISLLNAINNDQDISKLLDKNEIDNLTNLKKYLAKTELIFERTLLAYDK